MFYNLASAHCQEYADVQQYVFRQYGPLAVSVLAVLLLLAVARFLYVRQIFLRV